MSFRLARRNPPRPGVAARPATSRPQGLIYALPLNGVGNEIVTGANLTLEAAGSFINTSERGPVLLGSAAGGIGAGHIALDLSATNIITLSWWMYFDSYADGDKLCLEYTVSANANPGSFFIDPDAGAPATGLALIQFNQGGHNNSWKFTRPSAAAWHHWVVAFDGSSLAGKPASVWIDGLAVALTGVQSNVAFNSNFANDTLYILSRAGTALAAGGMIQHLKIYNTFLSQVEVLRDYYDPNGAYFAPRRFFPIGGTMVGTTTAAPATTGDLATGARFTGTATAQPTTGGILAGSARIVITLVDRTDAPLANLTNIKYSVWAETTVSTLATRMLAGTTGTTDASGVFALGVSGGVVTQSVFLILEDGSGRHYSGAEVLV